MSGARLWGGLESAYGEKPLRFGYAVEERGGYTPRAAVEAIAEREMNRWRREQGADPWAGWTLCHRREVVVDGRKELRAEVCSVRRGVVGSVCLVWACRADLEEGR